MTVNWRKIREDISNTSDKYLLAVSGGVDSMFMLDFFANSKLDLAVVHYNHKMRKTSDNEQYLVEEICLNRGIPFFCNSNTDLDKSSDEQEARNSRWAFVESIAKENGFEHIVTAHHADDQIENVFIRLMRGDPHDSLIMLTKNTKNGFVRYKPFLDVPKQAFYDECKKKNIRYIEDESNKDLRYDRNYIRNVIIPAFNQRTNIKTAIMTGINKGKVK
mgnify:CR=1 FL=1